jgi:hypothetical protein
MVFWTFPSSGVLGSRKTFRKLDLFPSSGGEVGEKTPTQLGPLERANLKLQFPKRCVSTPKNTGR